MSDLDLSNVQVVDLSAGDPDVAPLTIDPAIVEQVKAALAKAAPATAKALGPLLDALASP